MRKPHNHHPDLRGDAGAMSDILAFFPDNQNISVRVASSKLLCTIIHGVAQNWRAFVSLVFFLFERTGFDHYAISCFWSSFFLRAPPLSVFLSLFMSLSVSLSFCISLFLSFLSLSVSLCLSVSLSLSLFLSTVIPLVRRPLFVCRGGCFLSVALCVAARVPAENKRAEGRDGRTRRRDAHLGPRADDSRRPHAVACVKTTPEMFLRTRAT